ncbi:MAG: hypothetical protein AAGF11_51450 [Myxococcota bacterium]
MIYVEPQPEPDDFDAEVRRPGRAALEELVEQPDSHELGATYRITDLRYGDLPPLWRRCLPQLATAYQRICAYSCHYVEPTTGWGSVDHYVPKSLQPRLAYEWSNYRFACGRMNARKGSATDVLDPFEVEDGWFQIDLVRFQLHPAPGLPPELIARIERTIEQLRLNGDALRQTREDVCRDFWEGRISLPFLQRRYPLVAHELRRQGCLRPPWRVS